MAQAKTKTAAKKPASTAKKATAPKSKQAAAKKTPAKAGKAEAGKAKGDANYTKPELRERIKEKVKEGDKGGKPGQWSARKAQLVASEYEKQGGDYKEGGKSEKQEHLSSWTKEKWQTSDGKKAVRGKTTARYLPKKAWDKLSPAEKEATDTKKKAGSKTGKQNVANTAAAKKARKQTTK